MKYEISATSVVRLDRYNSAASAGNQPQHIVVCSVYSVQYFCILFFIGFALTPHRWRARFEAWPERLELENTALTSLNSWKLHLSLVLPQYRLCTVARRTDYSLPPPLSVLCTVLITVQYWPPYPVPLTFLIPAYCTYPGSLPGAGRVSGSALIDCIVVKLTVVHSQKKYSEIFFYIFLFLSQPQPATMILCQKDLLPRYGIIRYTVPGMIPWRQGQQTRKGGKDTLSALL
jgi:hypothetical protein